MTVLAVDGLKVRCRDGKTSSIGSIRLCLNVASILKSLARAGSLKVRQSDARHLWSRKCIASHMRWEQRVAKK